MVTAIRNLQALPVPIDDTFEAHCSIEDIARRWRLGGKYTQSVLSSVIGAVLALGRTIEALI